MVIFFRYILYLVSVASVVGGCKRQPIYSLESQTNEAKINFVVDWSTANIDTDNINNISIYAYREGNDSPYIKISGNINASYINLPEGNYSLIIFNDFSGDLKGINLANTETFDQITAEIIEQEDTSGLYYQPQSGEIIAQEMTELAVWRMDEFEVSAEMVWCSCCEESGLESEDIIVEVTPTAITTPCNISVSIDNLNNAAYIEAAIKALASSANISTGERLATSDVTTIYIAELNSLTFSSDSNGTASGQAETFGKTLDSSLSYEVVINIILNSGEMVTFTRDVTDQILEQSNAEIVIYLTSDEEKITLPESGSIGFGVEEWGDNEQIMVL